MPLNKLVLLIYQLDLNIDVGGNKRLKRVSRRIKAEMTDYLQRVEAQSPPDYETRLYPTLDDVEVSKV